MTNASGRLFGIAFAIGNAMPILGLPGLIALWTAINGYENQIDDLKRELESMKQN